MEKQTRKVGDETRPWNVRTDAVMRYYGVAERRKPGVGTQYTMAADYHSAMDNQIWQQMLVVAEDADSPVEIQCMSAFDAPCIIITSAAILADASPDFDLYVHSMNVARESHIMTRGLFREIEREMHDRIRQYNAEVLG
jgi:hypothetical protein